MLQFSRLFYLIVQNHKSSNREKFVYIVSYTRKYLFNLTIFCQLIIFARKYKTNIFITNSNFQVSGFEKTRQFFLKGIISNVMR